MIDIYLSCIGKENKFYIINYTFLYTTIIKCLHTNYDKSQQFWIFIFPTKVRKNKFYIIIPTFLYTKTSNCFYASYDRFSRWILVYFCLFNSSYDNSYLFVIVIAYFTVMLFNSIDLILFTNSFKCCKL